jgi:flavin-dependent dehydrogenase
MNDAATITIAGAGPSGLSAAIALARAGRRVVVHEAKPDVGSRFIGDLQILESFSEREDVPHFLDRIGIRTNFYFRPVHTSVFFDHRGRQQEVRSAEPYGYFIRRGPFEGSLDRGLLAQTRELGVEVRFGSRIHAEEADIVATGPASPDGLAKEITFTASGEEIIDVYFDHHLSPGGYSYLFILDGVATFGCAIVSDFKNIDRYFDHALERARRLRSFDPDVDRRTGYSYMNFHLKEEATRENVRFVGEAAGFQDYLFGLGIRYALTTGNLAARSILENTPFDELWKRELGAKQETSVANRFLYEIGGNLGLSLFARDAGRARDLRDYLHGWHERSWWKTMLSRVVQRFWKNDGRCLHKPEAHWCRSRNTQVRVPALGPVEPRSESKEEEPETETVRA